MCEHSDTCHHVAGEAEVLMMLTQLLFRIHKHKKHRRCFEAFYHCAVHPEKAVVWLAGCNLKMFNILFKQRCKVKGVGREAERWVSVAW